MRFYQSLITGKKQKNTAGKNLRCWQTGGMEGLLMMMRGRQAGIHLIVATALPMEHILTSLILCNIPSRIAFKVNNKKDSRRLIGTSEAIMLEEKGDMLYYPVTRDRACRLQGVYIDN